MPLEPVDFPAEVQVAFFIFDLLEDNWDGMSGTYMGKIWSNVEYFFKLYAIEEPKTVIYIMKLYEGLVVQDRAEKSENKRKAEQKKSAGGGKKYTHNVQG